MTRVEQRPSRQQPRPRIRKGRAFVVLLVLAVVFGGCGIGLMSLVGGGLADGPVVVEIPEGSGASEVAAILEEAGVIRSASVFKLQSRLDDRASRIRPGTYELTPGASFDEIMTILTAAPEAAPSFKVTIPEGLTVKQTLKRIADAENSPFKVRQLRLGLASVALPEWVPTELPEGAEPFEGLLFPSTYEFVVAAKAPEVLGKLVEQTVTVLDGLEIPERDRYEVLIKGSLIEREARLREEHPVISSVISNRIEQGMRLQIDATVIYAKGEDVNRVLTSDLEIDSPWNTYVVDGLPPTPIAGAGESALEGAYNPDDTDYLFYVVSDPETGEHVFAETLEEHNANVARYREQRAASEAADG